MKHICTASAALSAIGGYLFGVGIADGRWLLVGLGAVMVALNAVTASRLDAAHESLSEAIDKLHAHMTAPR